MGRRSRSIASAAGGVLVLLWMSAVAFAQSAPLQVGRVASLAPGSIAGVVQDERGSAVVGAIVSAFGPTTALAVTDASGRFELRTLSPGPYLVRAHLSGFVTSRGRIVEVRASARTPSSIALRHATATNLPSYPVLAAGMAGSADSGTAESAEPANGSDTPIDDDHSEVAWRLRHARRGILRDATLPGSVLANEAPTPDVFWPPGHVGRSSGLLARVATNFFGGAPFSGQFNLLTAGSFDTPPQLFSSDSFSRSVAYLSLAAPAGEHADWTVRGGLTQGDISSWIVAGAYSTRAPARHRYDLGLSYSTQRYDGGNPAALGNVVHGSRNAGALYGFDTFAITPATSLTYGARVARYDYLDRPGLISPRVAFTLSPADQLHINAVASRRALAPGAEEFAPPLDSAIWLPPQRTFSSLVEGRGLEAERTDHLELQVERDVTWGTLLVRAFRQHVAHQLVTLFGVDMPDAPARLGHYFVANTGDVDAAGWGAGLRTSVARRVHGSIDYAVSRARWSQADDLRYLIVLAPSAIRLESERVHDLATTVETRVPETSTRVLVLFRMSNAFALANDRPAFDSRFDVQVRQSLPFMNFGSARWEMLLVLRNAFREAAVDSSIYDELLVVRPPKRVVGGLTLRF